jgi:hypothetical protein
MRHKRVFKTRTFDRWARKVVADALLGAAAREIEQGRFEADLGHGVCKKRIAVPGQGKSGSTRTLEDKQHPATIVLLVGRRNSEPGPDCPDAVVEAVKAIADDLRRLKIERLDAMTVDGTLKEICHAQEAQ